MSETAEKYLNAQQLARVECLRAAREVLVAKTITGGVGVGAVFQGTSNRQAAADPIDLVSISRYIELGVDPYEVVREEIVGTAPASGTEPPRAE